MTPAPISVERLEALRAAATADDSTTVVRSSTLLALLQQLAEYEMAATAESQLADERGEKINQLRTQLLANETVLAEREAGVESTLACNRGLVRLNEAVTARAEAAERAREEATGLLRESIGEIRDAATDARVANLPNRGAHLDKLSARIAAFLAASGGA